MTQSQKIKVGELHRKHSIDVSNFGCRITTDDIGHAVVFTLFEGEDEDLKIRESYTISKRGKIS